MKKRLMAIVIAGVLLLLAGCGQTAQATETVQGNMKTYEKLSDNTWKCDGQTYQYCLEITGRMPNAAKDSTFTYLSNLPEISFEQAWKAAGLSSDRNDYFDPKDAVLVNME